MDIQNLLLISKYIFIVTIVFDVIVFMFVLFQKHKDEISRYFLYMSAVLVAWEVTLFGAFFIESSLFWNWWSDYFAFVLGPLGALCILHFLEKLYRKPILSKIMHLILICIAIIDVQFITIFMNQREQTGINANQFFIPNSFYSATYYASFLPVSLALIYVWFRIKKSERYNESKTKLILWGLLIAFSVATLTCVWFPLFFDQFLLEKFTLYHTYFIDNIIEIIGGIGLSIFTSIAAFAITRHRLFDIHVVIQNKYIRAAITVVGFIIVFILAYIVMLVTNSLSIFIFVALVGTVLAQFGFNAFFKKFITQSAYDFSLPPELELLDDTQAALDKLFELLQRDLRNDFGIEECVIYVHDRLDKQYRTMDSKPKLIPESHALVNLTNFKTEVVTRAQLEQSNNSITMAIRNELIHFFDKNGYSMVLPLYNPVMNYGFIGITRANESAADFNNPFIREKLLHLGEKYGYYLGQILTYEAMVGPSAKK